MPPTNNLQKNFRGVQCNRKTGKFMEKSQVENCHHALCWFVNEKVFFCIILTGFMSKFFLPLSKCNIKTMEDKNLNK